jgi:hypothetical protein
MTALLRPDGGSQAEQISSDSAFVFFAYVGFSLVEAQLTIDGVFPTLSAYRTFSLGCSWNPKFIAKRYGTTEGNLHNWLKKRGLKPAKV